MKNQNHHHNVTCFGKPTLKLENEPHSVKKSNSHQFKHIAALAAIVALLAASNAQAATITFEDLAVGTTLANQYSGLGVTFSANAFTGAGGPNGNWATNTDMTIVSSTGTDVGGLGTPALVSGNLLRSFNGWLSEDGDPSILLSFSSAVSSFSATFAGVSVFADTRLFVYDGTTLLGTVAGATTGQFVLSFSAPSITKVVITPGNFNDWVGVDNITFEPVPEPGVVSLAVMGGLALMGARRRAAAQK